MMKFEHIYLSDSYDREEYLCNIIDDYNKNVGYCKYYKLNSYDDTVYIEYIFINEDDRRKKYATQMVIELNKNHKLEWDYRFTKIGRHWYNGLIKNGIIVIHNYIY